MFIRHLRQALPAELCNTLRDFASGQTFEPATVNYYGKTQRQEQVRNNARLEWDNAPLAQQLEALLLGALGNDFPFTLDGLRYASVGSHFRFYRYRPGEYFKPHKDGAFRKGELESLVTVLWYLNTPDGGETVLMRHGPREQWAYEAVAPCAGDVLLFEHRVWHEGRPVHTGEKYVLRTDLFYRQGG